MTERSSVAALTDIKAAQQITATMSLMPTTVQRIKNCRAHADQCRAQADICDHGLAKAEYLKLAEQWDLLAREIDAIERMRTFVEIAERH